MKPKMSMGFDDSRGEIVSKLRISTDSAITMGPFCARMVIAWWMFKTMLRWLFGREWENYPDET